VVNREVVGSNNTHSYCWYQHQLSMPSLQAWLVSTSKNWGVNRHTTGCTSPVSVVYGFGWCPNEGYRKQGSAPPYGPLRLR